MLVPNQPANRLPLHHASVHDPLGHVDHDDDDDDKDGHREMSPLSTTIYLGTTDEYGMDTMPWYRQPGFRKKWMIALFLLVLILMVLIWSVKAAKRHSGPDSALVKIPLSYGVCRLTVIELYLVNSSSIQRAATTASNSTSEGSSSGDTSQARYNNQSNIDTQSFECAIVVDPIDSNPSNDDDVALFVNLPYSLVQEHAAAMNRKDWYLAYDPVWVHDPTDSMTIPAGTELISMTGKNVQAIWKDRKGTHQQRRILGEKTGLDRDSRRVLGSTSSDEDSSNPDDHFTNNGKVIIARITTADGVVTHTAEELYNAILGDGPLSLKAQVGLCSGGAVNLIPYDPDNPVVEITVPKKTSEYYFNQIFYDANPVLKQLYNVKDFWGLVSHVIFVAPDGMKTPPGSVSSEHQDIAVYAGVDHFKVIFTDSWATNVGVLLHETGHNRGLGHAWMDGVEYADISGAMGAAVANLQYVCYNGAQNDQLQWMMDRYVAVDPYVNPVNESGRVDLVAFTDYAQSAPGQVVNLHIGNVWMIYNRDKSFNQDTALRQDQVIVHRRKENTTPVATELVGAIDATTQNFVVTNYYAPGVDLAVVFCRIQENPDLITLGIGTSINDDLCSKDYILLARPPTAPGTTSSPTRAPALATPTLKPTNRPTTPVRVTATPTRTPVGIRPTVTPTSSPTRKRRPPPPPPVRPTSSDDSGLEQLGDTAYAQHGNNIFIPLYTNEQVVPRTPGTTCEDYYNILMFINDAYGHQSCMWIKQHLYYLYNSTATIKQALCVPSSDVYLFCETTCGKCVPGSATAPPSVRRVGGIVMQTNSNPVINSSCRDNNAVQFQYMGGNRTCEWIAARNYLWDFACETQAVRDACQYTCQSC